MDMASLPRRRSASVSHPPAAEGLKPPANAAAISLWARNVQLSFFSIIIGVFVVAAEHASRNGAASSQWATDLSQSSSVLQFFEPVRQVWGDFLEGFTALTWVVITIQAVGGLLTALVVYWNLIGIHTI